MAAASTLPCPSHRRKTSQWDRCSDSPATAPAARPGCRVWRCHSSPCRWGPARAGRLHLSPPGARAVAAPAWPAQSPPLRHRWRTSCRGHCQQWGSSKGGTPTVQEAGVGEGGDRCWGRSQRHRKAAAAVVAAVAVVMVVAPCLRAVPPSHSPWGSGLRCCRRGYHHHAVQATWAAW
jgi:hypothetical protein